MLNLLFTFTNVALIISLFVCFRIKYSIKIDFIAVIEDGVRRWFGHLKSGKKWPLDWLIACNVRFQISIDINAISRSLCLRVGAYLLRA